MTYFQRHAYGIGCGIAGLFWPFFGRRRAISVDNLMRAGVAKNPEDAARLAKVSFCHFLGHMFEAICLPKVMDRENWRSHIDTTGASPKTADLLLNRPKEPIIIVSGHHGCWEAATNLLSLGGPMIAIARVMDNRFLRSWMKNHHFRGPVTVIDRNKGFTPAIMRQWRDENAAMTILIDQYAWRGALLKFFGRPARTVTSAARLAIRSGAPVAVGSFVRIAPYRYRFVCGDPLVFPRDASVESAAQLLNDRLEAAIRAYPEQYLWMHRRWRDD